MVTKDVSRFLVQSRKRYTGARLAQGRVLLDSDFNEHHSLAREDQRRVLVDVIGPAGSPDLGLSIRRPLDAPGDATDRLRPGVEVPAVIFSGHILEGGSLVPRERRVHPVAIRPGSLYAGGLRFDLENAESLLYQRDFLQLSPADLPEIEPGEQVRYLYYLRGWEQAVSALEDPELREVMLRGTDTSVRLRRMRRVEVLELGDAMAHNCDQAWAVLQSHLESEEGGSFDERSYELRSGGRLRIEFVGGEAEDACAPCDPFGKRYLGAENQTLRVLLTQRDRFVWALDDPRLFRVRVHGLDEEDPDEIRVELIDLPQEERDWPFQNRVVEILPFGALLEGADVPGPADPHYRKVAAEVGVFTRALETFDRGVGSFAIDRGEAGELLAALQALVHRWPEAHPYAAQLNTGAADGPRDFYMRLWHQAATRDAIELPTDDPPVLGTTGIQPHFSPGQRGDYWILALRPNAPKEVVPFELLEEGGAPPAGPRRFFAPLAFVVLEGDMVVHADDCRPRIRPLNNRLCTSYSVGDGIHSFGDFTRINDALAALPRSGGVISVRPGVYRETIGLNGRRDVVIEGCGNATILRGNPGFEHLPVIRIDDCERIHLRSFAVQSVGPGIVTHGGSDIALADLEVAGGDFGGIQGAFREGRGQSDATLLELRNTDHVSLRDLLVRPKRQRGIVVRGNHLDVQRLRARGSAQAVIPRSAPALFELQGVSGATVRDASFVVFTQTALSIVPNPDGQVPSRELTFSEIDIDAAGVPEVSGASSQVLTPFDLDDADSEGVSLRRSRIRMRRAFSIGAAVSVQGQRITIEHNRITTDADGGFPMGWGGIHVRGGSRGVSLRHNRIEGGVGHGVTLGSVRWGTARGEPGRGQMRTEDDSTYVSGLLNTAAFPDGRGGVGTSSNPQDEGEITDVVIADNRIEGFSTNGIGAVTVLGVRPPGPPGVRFLLEASRLRIERNLIRNNVRRPDPETRVDTDIFPFPTSRTPSRTATFLSVPYLPLGGIVLANARNVEITDNVIEGNGRTEFALDAPISGVFVLAGDSIVIEGNRITKNGQLPDDPARPLRLGVRAGIAVMLAGTSTQESSSRALDDFLFRPATDLDNHGVALRVANNTVLHPEGRALHAVAVGPVSIDGNFLSSQGNHGDPTRTSQLAIGDVVYVQNLGAPWETFGFAGILDQSPPGSRTSSEYWIENTPHLSPIMLNRAGGFRGSPPSPVSPRWYTGLGGGILFCNNQVVYDWTLRRLPTEPGAPLSFFPNVLLSVDHTTVVGNQFAVRLDGIEFDPEPQPELPLPHPSADIEAPLFATLLATGVTVNVELNRFSETLRATLLSLLVNGDILNITTLNQSTHRVASMVTRRAPTNAQNPDVYIAKENLVLIAPPDGMSENALINTVKPALQNFQRLSFRPRR